MLRAPPRPSTGWAPSPQVTHLCSQSPFSGPHLYGKETALGGAAWGQAALRHGGGVSYKEHFTRGPDHHLLVLTEHLLRAEWLTPTASESMREELLALKPGTPRAKAFAVCFFRGWGAECNFLGRYPEDGIRYVKGL